MLESRYMGGRATGDFCCCCLTALPSVLLVFVFIFIFVFDCCPLTSPLPLLMLSPDITPYEDEEVDEGGEEIDAGPLFFPMDKTALADWNASRPRVSGSIVRSISGMPDGEINVIANK